MNIFVGTCGWSYREWVGKFYPEGIRPSINYYALFFNAVEIDSTYYAIPSFESFGSTLKKIKKDMKISVKVPSSITHVRNDDRKIKGNEFNTNVVEQLRRKNPSSPIMFTIPPWISVDTLEEYLMEINKILNFPSELYAEARFFSENDLNRTQKIIENNGINCCFTDSIINRLKLSKINQENAYIRMQGRNPSFAISNAGMEKFDYNYKNEELGDFIRQIKKIEDLYKNIFIFFNNHPNGNAATNALHLARELKVTKQGKLDFP